MKYWNGQKGQAILPVMIMLLAIVLLLGGATYTLAAGSKKISTYQRNLNQAYYIADAGVERILARAKYDPDWLNGIDPEKAEIILQNESYAGGAIKEAVLTKETASDNKTSIKIQSVGEYRNSKRSLAVHADIFIVRGGIFRGMWICSGEEFKPDMDFSSPVWVNSDLIILNSCDDTGNCIYVGRNVVITREKSLTARNIYALGDITLENGSLINGDIRCKGNVTLDEGAKVDNIYTEGFLTIAGGADIGSIHVKNADQIPSSWRNANPGKWDVDQSLNCAFTIPSFPGILTDENLAWYKQNADCVFTSDWEPDENELQNMSDIYYVEGNLTISGTYSGRTTIVAKGAVTINNTLKPNDCAADCLLILSKGNINLTANKKEVAALLYSEGTVSLADNTEFNGGITAKMLEGGGGNDLHITYNEKLAGNKQNWVTNIVKITRWNERYSVF